VLSDAANPRIATTLNVFFKIRSSCQLFVVLSASGERLFRAKSYSSAHNYLIGIRERLLEDSHDNQGPGPGYPYFGFGVVATLMSVESGMSRHTLSRILLVVSSLLAALGLATLIPHTSRMVSYLGYETLCPFAPWSSLTLLMLAALGWVVRQYVNSQPAGR
jgi:hypothetical protein